MRSKSQAFLNYFQVLTENVFRLGSPIKCIKPVLRSEDSIQTPAACLFGIVRQEPIYCHKREENPNVNGLRVCDGFNGPPLNLRGERIQEEHCASSDCQFSR